MCGELVVFGNIDQVLALRLLGAIKHRGPEATRLESSNGVTIGFVRLALSDPHACSMQPLTIPSFPDVTLTYNGEIYDAHTDVKTGHLDTHLDGELLLRSVMDGRPEVMTAIRGVYSAVIIDRKACRVTILHDRVGVRGMWTCTGPDGQRAWCSEYQGLPWPNTASMVPGGTHQTWDMDPATGMLRNAVTSRPCSWPIVRPVINGNLTYMRRAVFGSLMTAIDRRWNSRDKSVKVTCLLSGGLDSALVYSACVHIARNKGEAPPLAFTGVMLDANGAPTGTDVHAAIATSRALQTGDTHHIVPINPMDALRTWETMPVVLGSVDPTTCRASTMMAHVMDAVAKRAPTNHKIVMSGEGADEVAAGYTNQLRAPSPAAMDKECRRLIDALPGYDVWRSDVIISRFGKEGRFPFLDVDFIATYLSVPPELRMPGAGLDGLEGGPGVGAPPLTKSFLRGAIHACEPKLMHPDVLWGTKKAFSDSTSGDFSPWHLTVAKHAAQKLQADPATSSCPFPEVRGFDVARTAEEHLLQRTLARSAPKMKQMVPVWRPAFVPSGVTSAREWEAEVAGDQSAGAPPLALPVDVVEELSSTELIMRQFGVSWYRARAFETAGARPRPRPRPRRWTVSPPPTGGGLSRLADACNRLNRTIMVAYASSLTAGECRWRKAVYGGNITIMTCIDLEMEFVLKPGHAIKMVPGVFPPVIRRWVMAQLLPLLSSIGSTQ